jgi:hypothetical protein
MGPAEPEAKAIVHRNVYRRRPERFGVMAGQTAADGDPGARPVESPTVGIEMTRRALALDSLEGKSRLPQTG